MTTFVDERGSEPARVHCLSVAQERKAIAAMVGALEQSKRIPYAPVPYELRGATKDSMRGLAKGETASRAVWHLWRMNLTDARSKNESNLVTILWGIVASEHHGDAFTGDTLRAWLRDEWQIDRPPLRDAWDDFCRLVCNTGHPWWMLAPDGRQGT